MALSTTTHNMKPAIVALGLGKDYLIMVNCAANLVIQVLTLLFQTDLVPDGRAGGVNPVGIYGTATLDGTRQSRPGRSFLEWRSKEQCGCFTAPEASLHIQGLFNERKCNLRSSIHRGIPSLRILNRPYNVSSKQQGSKFPLMASLDSRSAASA